jgi:hypothetical protein
MITSSFHLQALPCLLLSPIKTSVHYQVDFPLFVFSFDRDRSRLRCPLAAAASLWPVPLPVWLAPCDLLPLHIIDSRSSSRSLLCCMSSYGSSIGSAVPCPVFCCMCLYASLEICPTLCCACSWLFLEGACVSLVGVGWVLLMEARWQLVWR